MLILTKHTKRNNKQIILKHFQTNYFKKEKKNLAPGLEDETLSNTIRLFLRNFINTCNKMTYQDKEFNIYGRKKKKD